MYWFDRKKMIWFGPTNFCRAQLSLSWVNSAVSQSIVSQRAHHPVFKQSGFLSFLWQSERTRQRVQFHQRNLEQPLLLELLAFINTNDGICQWQTTNSSSSSSAWWPLSDRQPRGDMRSVVIPRKRLVRTNCAAPMGFIKLFTNNIVRDILTFSPQLALLCLMSQSFNIKSRWLATAKQSRGL